MNNDSYESTSAVDLHTKKMDTVLAKLQKLDSIENWLRTCLRPCQIWKTLFAGLDKEVHNLKEKVSNTNKTIKELEDSVDINDGEIADLKRDLRASDKVHRWSSRALQ